MYYLPLPSIFIDEMSWHFSIHSYVDLIFMHTALKPITSRRSGRLPLPKGSEEAEMYVVVPSHASLVYLTSA
jgi:hypothetical protein